MKENTNMNYTDHNQNKFCNVLSNLKKYCCNTSDTNSLVFSDNSIILNNIQNYKNETSIKHENNINSGYHRNDTLSKASSNNNSISNTYGNYIDDNAFPSLDKNYNAKNININSEIYMHGTDRLSHFYEHFDYDNAKDKYIFQDVSQVNIGNTPQGEISTEDNTKGIIINERNINKNINYTPHKNNIIKYEIYRNGNKLNYKNDSGEGNNYKPTQKIYTSMKGDNIVYKNGYINNQEKNIYGNPNFENNQVHFQPIKLNHNTSISNTYNDNKEHKVIDPLIDHLYFDIKSEVNEKENEKSEGIEGRLSKYNGSCNTINESIIIPTNVQPKNFSNSVPYLLHLNEKSKPKLVNNSNQTTNKRKKDQIIKIKKKFAALLKNAKKHKKATPKKGKIKSRKLRLRSSNKKKKYTFKKEKKTRKIRDSNNIKKKRDTRKFKINTNIGRSRKKINIRSKRILPHKRKNKHLKKRRIRFRGKIMPHVENNKIISAMLIKNRGNRGKSRHNRINIEKKKKKNNIYNGKGITHSNFNKKHNPKNTVRYIKKKKNIIYDETIHKDKYLKPIRHLGDEKNEAHLERKLINKKDISELHEENKSKIVNNPSINNTIIQCSDNCSVNNNKGTSNLSPKISTLSSERCSLKKDDLKYLNDGKHTDITDNDENNYKKQNCYDLKLENKHDAIVMHDSKNGSIDSNAASSNNLQEYDEKNIFFELLNILVIKLIKKNFKSPFNNSFSISNENIQGLLFEGSDKNDNDATLNFLKRINATLSIENMEGNGFSIEEEKDKLEKTNANMISRANKNRVKYNQLEHFSGDMEKIHNDMADRDNYFFPIKRKINMRKSKSNDSFFDSKLMKEKERRIKLVSTFLKSDSPMKYKIWKGTNGNKLFKSNIIQQRSLFQKEETSENKIIYVLNSIIFYSNKLKNMLNISIKKGRYPNRHALTIKIFILSLIFLIKKVKEDCFFCDFFYLKQVIILIKEIIENLKPMILNLTNKTEVTKFESVIIKIYFIELCKMSDLLYSLDSITTSKVNCLYSSLPSKNIGSFSSKLDNLIKSSENVKYEGTNGTSDIICTNDDAKEKETNCQAMSDEEHHKDITNNNSSNDNNVLFKKKKCIYSYKKESPDTKYYNKHSKVNNYNSYYYLIKRLKFDLKGLVRSGIDKLYNIRLILQYLDRLSYIYKPLNNLEGHINSNNKIDKIIKNINVQKCLFFENNKETILNEEMTRYIKSVMKRLTNLTNHLSEISNLGKLENSFMSKSTSSAIEVTKYDNSMGKNIFFLKKKNSLIEKNDKYSYIDETEEFDKINAHLNSIINLKNKNVGALQDYNKHFNVMKKYNQELSLLNKLQRNDKLLISDPIDSINISDFSSLLKYYVNTNRCNKKYMDKNKNDGLPKYLRELYMQDQYSLLNFKNNIIDTIPENIYSMEWNPKNSVHENANNTSKLKEDTFDVNKYKTTLMQRKTKLKSFSAESIELNKKRNHAIKYFKMY
ncbi:hypothetical protein YYG_02713 [Plasmodium vinckei petteri]|uniref:Uncharacterized protein n=1 Tax=Plasmodium vinckei petteri TaxID=138298 RepID=W7AF72_PLAVN|nr:hypothetical protein YYG_02713 [Plasmodium vinckei petteri]CAD2102976.1 conserved Plasmodium protein, unknown function [Plasmodium vinckei petteri]